MEVSISVSIFQNCKDVNANPLMPLTYAKRDLKKRIFVRKRRTKA